MKRETFLIDIPSGGWDRTHDVQATAQPDSEDEIKAQDISEADKTDIPETAAVKETKTEYPVKETSVPEKSGEDNQSASRLEKAINEMNSVPTAIAKESEAKGGVSFNFDNADLYEVVRTMAEILNINYIFDVNINGTVTIHTAKEISRSDLFPLFFEILELNGLTALKEGNLYKITPKQKITGTPILTRYGRNMSKTDLQERLIMQIIPLEYIKATEIVTTLEPFISETGVIIPRKESDVLIIIDKINNIKRILQLVDVFDVDLFSNIQYRFFKLENIEAADAAKLINDLITPFLMIKESECRIIPVERLNTLVVISSEDRILKKIEEFISKIDTQEDSEDPRVFIYKVKNSKAEDLASILNSIFKKSGTSVSSSDSQRSDVPLAGSDKKNTESVLFPKKEMSQDQVPSAVPAVPVKGNKKSNAESSLGLPRDVTIIADKIRNALIVEAVPQDYQNIQRILKELDVLPRQVLINVLILDVNLSDSRTLGVEWSFVRDRVEQTGLQKATLGAGGLSFTAGLTEEWLSAVSALANDDLANVLSAPSILASDNKAANINVVTQIPVTTSTYDTDSGVTTTSVQYRDTGIILSVTPHINDHGMVSMDINQEVSSKVDSSAADNNPSFFNRNVSTSLSVKDKQSIVIGGLISETKSDNTKGVPWLSRLPGIGFLFGQEKKANSKNELIIIITPRVMNTIDDIDSVSLEFASKFEGFNKRKGLIELFPEK